MDPIEELLTRGVETIVPGKEELAKLLKSGKILNIYNGVDPTAVRIHLGHAVPLRKLQQLVEMGHRVTFLIGDFTAFIGDTSDKNTERPQLTEEQIENNWQTYKKQAEKLLDFSKVRVARNSEWLDKLTMRDAIKFARHFSLNDFISRELIKKRLSEGGSINLAEVLYPLAQGYDSYHLNTDLQIGGTEQIFNIQAGRTLIKDFDRRESFAMTNSILEGTDGRRMSKSWGNAIWIEDAPEEMYGKAMSLRDNLIVQYFTLATNVSMEKVKEVGERLKKGENPMILKKELAYQIVSELHSTIAADKAQEKFAKTFQEKNLAEADLPQVPTPASNVVDAENLVAEYGQVSHTEAKRLLEQGAVECSGTVLHRGENVKINTGDILKIGKTKFLKFA